MTSKHGDVPARWRRFLRDRWPELLLFLLGVLVRLSMTWSYDASWSYDSNSHWEVVEWILKHHRIPTPDDVFEAFHPPLWYVFVAGLVSLGAHRAAMVWVSIIGGTLRLSLLWLGLEIYLPKDRPARIAALALASVLAASVHTDGMIYAEAMSGLLLTAAMVVAPQVFRREGWARARAAGGLGLLLGLALLTKISALVVIGSIGVVAIAELVLGGGDARARGGKVLSWAAMLAVVLAVAGWYFSRNVRDYGALFVTSFDVKSQHYVVAEAQKVPYLHRRSLEFFIGWDWPVMLFPYFPSATGVHPTFFPAAVASTFMDYWNYSFSGVDPGASIPGWPVGILRPMTHAIFRASEYAVWGGTVIFLATVVSWIVVTWRELRARAWDMLALLAVPLFTLVSAMHFAVKYPIDNYGVVKGVYMHFGAPPMYALFGLAVSWTLRARSRWPLFAILMAGLWLVASYTLLCRLRVPIAPFG